VPINTTGALATVNYGLALIGIGPITTFDGEDPRAVQIRSVYEVLRRSVLGEYHWNFAFRAKLLVALEAGQLNLSDEFNYVYKVPQKALSIRGLQSCADYQVYAGELYTNDNAPNVLYVEDVDDTGWPPWFVRAFGMQIASDLALPLTQSDTRAAKASRDASHQWAVARHNDALESTPLRVLFNRLLNDPVKPRFGRSGSARMSVVP